MAHDRCAPLERIRALRRYEILDTPREPDFDDIVRLLAHVCRAPIAVINFIDADRQWFKAEIGLDIRETPLDISICAHAILQPGLFIVPDTAKDSRFADNPLVTADPRLRFYAGALLESSDGHALGTLCVLDHEPRELDEDQKHALRTLARHVMALLEHRREVRLQLEANRRIEDFADAASDWFWETDADLRFTFISERMAELTGVPVSQRLGRTPGDLVGEGIREPKWQAHLNELRSRRPFRNFETSYRHESGQVRYARMSGTPVFSPEGTFLGYRGTATDITREKEAEEKLLRKSELLELALQASDNGIWDWNIKTGDIWLSPRYKEMLGYSDGELPTEPDTWDRLANPEDREKALRLMRDCLEGRTPYFEAVVRLRHKNGSTRHILDRALVKRDADGTPSRMVGVHIDLTDRLEASERLRRSEQRFKDFADATSDWFWETDADLRYTYFSAAGAGRGGLSASDMIGKVRTEITDEDTTSPKWKAHLHDLCDRRPFRDFEYRVRANDGGVLYARASGKPIFSPEGDFLGYRGTTVNLTGQRKAEEALKLTQARVARAEQLLADAIESLSEGFILLDAERRFVLCNARYREFYPAIAGLLVPGTRFDDIMRRSVLCGEVGLEVDLDVHLADRFDPARDHYYAEERLASGRWIQISDHRTRDGGTVGIRTDVTEQKLIETELRIAKEAAEKASRAKSDFLASMSHELRTPLNAVIGFSDLIARQVFGPAGNNKYAEYAEDIHRSGKHLLAVINDLLDMAKIETGRLRLREEIVGLNEAVEEAVRLARIATPDQRHRFEVGSEAPSLKLRADPRALRQILLNVVGNAIKFTPACGAIRVHVRIDAGDPCIMVEDTGVGIPEERLDDVGQPFTQVENVLSRKHDGSGIGLFITKSFVDLHGGRLEIESTVGIGTRVVVRLPKSRISACTMP